MKTISHSCPTIGEEEKRAVMEVLSSNQISYGKMAHLFEQEFSKFMGTKFSLAVISGTSALHLALAALGIGKNDQVILPSYTCVAVLNAVLLVGAEPIIVDVNENDFNLDIEKAKRAISSSTKAIILVHTYGLPANINEFLALGIPVIEDAAQSTGANFQGKRVGSYGICGIFSFYATKMITTGGGGMLISNDDFFISKARDLADYKGKNDFKLRFNYLMPDIQAAIGLEQLKKLPSFIEKRRYLAKLYFENLKDAPIAAPDPDRYTDHIFYRYLVRLKNADKGRVIAELRKFNISAGYGVLEPLHRVCQLDDKDFPITTELWKNGISLPIYPSLSENDIIFICEKLKRCL